MMKEDKPKAKQFKKLLKLTKSLRLIRIIWTVLLCVLLIKLWRFCSTAAKLPYSMFVDLF